VNKEFERMSKQIYKKHLAWSNARRPNQSALTKSRVTKAEQTAVCTVDDSMDDVR
jgi:hypothetical protein